ncbi:MAG: DegT/DnrJ/EryC1/StrS family aminotransferase [Patescibacteria group bacterium]
MIPLFPTLDPRYFFQPKQPSPTLPFPLNTERVRYYYFARNGIWEALQILKVQPGDEALMPAFTSGIEVDVVIAAGLTPIIYDLHEDFIPNYEDIKKKLSSRTKILYITHYLGFPQPLSEALAICKDNSLFLFEDVALGFLSSYEDGESLGSKGDVAIFCPRKTVPIPHGGLLVVNNQKLLTPANRQRHPSRYSTTRQLISLALRNMASSRNSRVQHAIGSWMGTRVVPHMNTILKRAGITNTECGGFEFDTTKTDWGMSAISKYLLPRFDYECIKRRHRENYLTLAASLSGIPELKVAFPILQAYTVPLDLMILTPRRDEITTQLQRQGIETSVLWPHYRSHEIGNASPFIKKVLHEHLVLPIHQDVTTSDTKTMAHAIRKICSS